VGSHWDERQEIGTWPLIAALADMMKITTANQYRTALAALQHLSDMTDDPDAQERRRELEAATADYAERLKARDLSKGRPKQHLYQPRAARSDS
jgi:hypothetical protein